MGNDYLNADGNPVRNYTLNQNLSWRATSSTLGAVKQSQVTASGTIMVYERPSHLQGHRAAAAYVYSDMGDRHSYHQKSGFIVFGFADGSVRNLHNAGTSDSAAGAEDLWDVD